MKKKLLYIAGLFFLVLVAGCSLDSSVENDDPIINPPASGYEIKNPVPLHGTIVQTRNVQLNWYAEGEPAFYTVIFDTHPEPNNVLVSFTNSTVIHKSRLRERRRYYWKVTATYPDGSTVTSPEWNFVVDNLYPDGYSLVIHKSETALPSKVSVLFQVLNLDNKGITGLTTNSFDIFDDGAYIHQYESNASVSRLNELPGALKTIIMIDNSSSVDSTELETLKNSVRELLHYGIEPYQSTALYTFSETITELSSFTTDYALLENMVSSILPGRPTTDLYGAVIAGVSKLEDIYTDNFAQQGVLIVFTDGKDTQSKHTLNEAMSATRGKQVIMVSYDYINQIDFGILTQLATDDLYYTTEMEFLKDRITEYRERLQAYVNSFYLLDYTSPKRGEAMHQITIRVKNNVYEGTGSFINADYNSRDFY